MVEKSEQQSEQGLAQYYNLIADGIETMESLTEKNLQRVNEWTDFNVSVVQAVVDQDLESAVNLQASYIDKMQKDIVDSTQHFLSLTAPALWTKSWMHDDVENAEQKTAEPEVTKKANAKTATNSAIKEPAVKRPAKKTKNRVSKISAQELSRAKLKKDKATELEPS